MKFTGVEQLCSPTKSFFYIDVLKNGITWVKYYVSVIILYIHFLEGLNLNPSGTLNMNKST